MSALSRPMTRFGVIKLTQQFISRRSIPRAPAFRHTRTPIIAQVQRGGAGADFTPSSFARGEAQFSRFFPPEARDFTYSRHIMIAVDGSPESVDGTKFVMKHLVRSGDLVHLVHIAVPDSAGAYLSIATPPGTEFNLGLDYEARDEFWKSAVKKTEEMLNDFCEAVTHDESGGGDMTPFTPPIELDCILDLTWEPCGEILLQKAKASGAAFICVTQHHKSWLEKFLYGSVSNYIIGNDCEPPIHVFVYHAPKREEHAETKEMK